MLDPNGFFIGGGATFQRRSVPLTEPVNGLVSNNGEVTEVLSRFHPVVAQGSTAFVEGRYSSIPGDTLLNASLIAIRETASDVLAAKIEYLEPIIEIDNAAMGLDGVPLETMGGDIVTNIEDSSDDVELPNGDLFIIREITVSDFPATVALTGEALLAPIVADANAGSLVDNPGSGANWSGALPSSASYPAFAQTQPMTKEDIAAFLTQYSLLSSGPFQYNIAVGVTNGDDLYTQGAFREAGRFASPDVMFFPTLNADGTSYGSMDDAIVAGVLDAVGDSIGYMVNSIEISSSSLAPKIGTWAASISLQSSLDIKVSYISKWLVVERVQ